MPTYRYQVIADGREVEVEQRITAPALTVLEVEGKVVSVKRLINGTPMIDLRSGPSGGWAASGYSKPENHRQAEAILGRKLIPPGGR